jgi:hypothetical protein
MSTFASVSARRSFISLALLSIASEPRFALWDVILNSAN